MEVKDHVSLIDLSKQLPFEIGKLLVTYSMFAVWGLRIGGRVIGTWSNMTQVLFNSVLM